MKSPASEPESQTRGVVASLVLEVYAGRGILCDIDNIDFANMVPMHQGLMDFVCTHCVANVDLEPLLVQPDIAHDAVLY